MLNLAPWNHVLRNFANYLGIIPFARKKVPACHPRAIDQYAKRMSETEILEPDPLSRGGSRFAITSNMQLPSKWISTRSPLSLPLPSPLPFNLPPAGLPLCYPCLRVECTEHFTRRALWPVDSNSNLRKPPYLPTLTGVLSRSPNTNHANCISRGSTGRK